MSTPTLDSTKKHDLLDITLSPNFGGCSLLLSENKLRKIAVLSRVRAATVKKINDGILTIYTMKNNTTLLYIIIGLLSAVLVITLYCAVTMNRNHMMMGDMGGNMMHQTPNGSMVGGNGHMDMDSMMSSMMAELEGKTGDAFDKAFLSEMIVHHEGAVFMAEAVLKSSKRPELIKLANEIISAQTGEITMMKNWQKAWFNIQN